MNNTHQVRTRKAIIQPPDGRLAQDPTRDCPHLWPRKLTIQVDIIHVQGTTLRNTSGPGWKAWSDSAQTLEEISCLLGASRDVYRICRAGKRAGSSIGLFTASIKGDDPSVR
ncbi:uncharacterized protein ACWYII_045367 isoform 2-T2 [Salvelinus alpinus]